MSTSQDSTSNTTSETSIPPSLSAPGNLGQISTSEIIIRPYQPSDSAFVLDHLLKCFKLESPLFSGLDMSEEESAPFFQHVICQAEKANVSYVAVDPDYQNPIIGCVLASIIDQEQKKHKLLNSQELQTLTPKQKTFLDFVDRMFSVAWQNLTTERILMLDIFSVAPEYRRRQLCQKMLQLCMKDAVDKKSCDIALVLVTSHKSQALTTAHNFVTVNMCYYDDYNMQQENDGCKILMIDPLNLSAKVMAKILV